MGGGWRNGRCRPWARQCNSSVLFTLVLVDGGGGAEQRRGVRHGPPTILYPDGGDSSGGCRRRSRSSPRVVDGSAVATAATKLE